ncbi:hypothetical protein [Phaffia rhodozyma]|uniref:Uncharacterized protein n=1 Tax=Phaffia rhodozyma TaxID=264483 RepID=A0A0F7SVC7_PHARH|nr:hypothetical protein [Phaffia rhodozyma]
MVLSTSPEQIGWSKEPEKPNYHQEVSSSPTRLYVLPRPTFYHDPRTSSFSVVSDITAESIQEETSSGEDFTPSYLYINQPDPEETEGSALSLLWDDTNSLDTVGSTACSARSRCRRPSPGQRRERNPELTSQAVSDTPDNAPSSSPRRSRGLYPSQSSAKRRSASASSSSNSSSCSSVLPSSSSLTHTRTRSQSFSLEPTIMETSNGYLSPAPRPIPTPRSVRFNPRTLLRTAYGSYSSDRSGELDLASPAVSFIGWRFPNAKVAGKRRAMSLSVERSASIDNWTAFYGSIGSTPRPGGTSLERSSTEPSIYPSRSLPGSSYLTNAPLLARPEDPLARPDLISDSSEPPWWERIWEGSFWAQKFGGCCSFLSLEDEDWSGSISSIDRGTYWIMPESSPPS